MTPGDYHTYLTRLAVEAGADPVRADERMRQAAQVFACELDALRERLAARATVISVLHEALTAARKRSAHA